MRAGIQNDLVFRNFPGFRVSLNIDLLARNDSFLGLRQSLRRGGNWGGGGFLPSEAISRLSLKLKGHRATACLGRSRPGSGRRHIRGSRRRF